MLALDFKSRITAKMHGSSITKLRDAYGMMYEAGGNLQTRLDLKSTRRKSNLSLLVCSGEYDIAAPSDLKDDAIIDFKPMKRPRGTKDYNTPRNSAQFDQQMAIDSYVVEDHDGFKTIKISKEHAIAPVAVSEFSSLTTDGTIAAGGGASNVAIDNNFFVSNGASLSFDLDTTGTGYITITGMAAKDLSDMLNMGYLFDLLYWPSSTILPTSVLLEWGQSDSAKWAKSVSVQNTGVAFEQGWNQLRHDWSSATKTGSPTTNITYVRITFTYTSGTAIPGVRLDQLVAVLGDAYQIDYYSQYLWKDATTGARKAQPTSDSDICVLDFSDQNLYLYEMMKIVFQEVQGEASTSDLDNIRRELFGNGATDEGLYDSYIEKYPSQRLTPNDTYYDMGYNRENSYEQG